jgi:hypothetical protein
VTQGLSRRRLSVKSSARTNLQTAESEDSVVSLSFQFAPKSLIFDFGSKAFVLGLQVSLLLLLVVYRAVGSRGRLLLLPLLIHFVANEVATQRTNTSADERSFGIAADCLPRKRATTGSNQSARLGRIVASTKHAK